MTAALPMDADAVRFGVVIPTYNRADLIAATLQSVLAQEHPAARIIVVDDGSTDDTVARARAFAPAVTVLEQTNAGPGAARNRGIDAADDCDYIAFLDSDDLFLPWTLATYAQALARHGRPAFLLSSAIEFRHDNELAQLHQQPISTQAFPDYYASSDADYWIGCSVVCVRRDALQAVGAFCPQRINQEDCDLWLKLGAAPGFVVIHQPTCSGRRWHEQNISHDRTRNLAGVRHLLTQAQTNAYPGGSARQRERLRILTRHIRPAAVACLRTGQRREAWELYRASFGWHLRLGRLRFLLGFPWVALVTKLKR